MTVTRSEWLRWRPATLLAMLVFAVAALVRLTTLEKQGLWADEVFSVAIATGHSLEHPASTADSTLGDFVERPDPVDAGVYRDYMTNDRPALGVGRVIRAVRKSDTSPPLYYAALHAWTLPAGTSDAAVRLFSVIWALGALALVWMIAVELGGRSVAIVACSLFALAPVAIRYSTEVRMYSMLWFFTLLAAWCSMRLRAGGTRPGTVAAWSLACAAGLLTHYFFVFVMGAFVAWLLATPRQADRRIIAASVAATGLLILPWYVLIPETMQQWRVTAGWLEIEPERHSRIGEPLELAWSYFSPRPWVNRTGLRLRRAAIFVVAVVVVLLLLDWRRDGARKSLLVLWIVAACAGPVVFDMFLGTYSAAILRYGLAGLPAAYILLALALDRVPVIARVAVVAGLLVLWLPGIRDLYVHPARSRASIRQVARAIGERATERDVLIVHSIPSGVLGVARYYDGAAPIVSWVGQLGVRQVPHDVDRIVAGRERVFVANVHAIGEPAVQDEYLRNRADVVEEFRIMNAQVAVFAPRGKPVFRAPESPADESAPSGARPWLRP